MDKKKYTGIDIHPKRIGDILKAAHHLFVPPNQRDYSWENKHVTDLLSDFNNAVRGNTAEYFLGTIVMAKDDEDDEKPRVVDGQQRLATTIIFISAIRDYLDEKNEGPEARKIETMYLWSPVLGEADHRPRLSLNDHDREYFFQRVLLPKNNPVREKRERENPIKPSHILIDKAAKKARTHVRTLTKNLERPLATAELMKQIRYLDKVVVIWVQVPDDKLAYTIFETMNDRGLDLSAADLIKNHLFRTAGDQLAESERQWSHMVGVLESVQETDIIKDYIRHFWISRYDLVRAQELFAEIKDRTQNQTNAMEMLSRLDTSSSKYVAILNPLHGFWDGYSDRSRRNIETLRKLNLKQARPLLLAVVERFPKHEIEKTLRLAVSWSVRFFVSGEIGSGELETAYAQNAVKINNGEIKTTEELSLAMSSVVPDDAQFQDDFGRFRVPKSANARYYLRCLEKQKRGEEQPENIPNDDPFEINLEHVLPQDPKPGQWSHFSAEDRLQFTDHIGNLALLRTKANTDADNEEFLVKKPTYNDSTYQLTKMLSQYDNWTVETIKSRASELATIAVGAWPIKI